MTYDLPLTFAFAATHNAAEARVLGDLFLSALEGGSRDLFLLLLLSRLVVRVMEGKQIV